MASELTAAVLAELKRLEKAATRPPWRADHGMNGLPWEIGGPMDDFENAVILADFGQVRRTPRWDDPVLGIPNARLVAALRNHAPALIAAAERAEDWKVEYDDLTNRLAESRKHVASLVCDHVRAHNTLMGMGGTEPSIDVVVNGIRALLTRADAAEKRVRELEEALKEIGRCDLGPSSADHLIGFRAAALARTALGKEPRT